MKIEQRAERQIELSLNTTPQPRRRMPGHSFQRRRDRARWWFGEMHRAVDHAPGLNASGTSPGDQEVLIRTAEG